MHTEMKLPKSWSTASFGGSVETSPMDLSALGEHLGACRNHNGRMFALHCAMQAMQDFIASRFVTTVMVVALLGGIASLVL